MHWILSKVTIPELVWAQDPILEIFFPTVFSLIMFPKLNVEKPPFNLVPPTWFFFSYHCFLVFFSVPLPRPFMRQVYATTPSDTEAWSPWFSQGHEEGRGGELSQSSAQGAAVSRWLRLPFTEKEKPPLGRLEIAHIISTREIHISAHL